ncbi:MAG: hypothetical protein GY823_07735 [Flavobacteriaceae bacterium]|nr:hypothetical protein [Flavobacteriaceae bacterium]
MVKLEQVFDRFSILHFLWGTLLYIFFYTIAIKQKIKNKVLFSILFSVFFHSLYEIKDILSNVQQFKEIGEKITVFIFGEEWAVFDKAPTENSFGDQIVFVLGVIIGIQVSLNTKINLIKLGFIIFLTIEFILFLILIIGAPKTESVISKSEEKSTGKLIHVLYFLIFTFVLIMPFFFFFFKAKKQKLN